MNLVESLKASGRPFTRHPLAKPSKCPELDAYFHRMREGQAKAFTTSFQVGDAMFRFHPIDTFDVLEELRTGHRNPTPRNPMKLIMTILFAAVIGWLVSAFTSCSFSVSADGAKSFSVDGEQAAKAIKILTDK